MTNADASGRKAQVELCAGLYRLVLNPAFGGSVAIFDWNGSPLMRAGTGPSIFDTACFPLVPFSNRIAQGRFGFGGQEVQLAPNFPGRIQPHAIHGFAWLAEWNVVEASGREAVLRHHYEAGEWPWSYVAEQRFALSGEGLRQDLSVRNFGDTPMPTGLGFHPYFPRSSSTRYFGAHRGEWSNGPDELPRRLDWKADAVDWWGGQPVSSRKVDTVYSGRSGPLRVEWPERDLQLTIAPCAMLSHTVVYVPADQPIFCVEPVSHSTDAINRETNNGEMLRLAPQESFAVQVAYRAGRLGGGSALPKQTD